MSSPVASTTDARAGAIQGRPTLRRAGLTDARRLCELFRRARPGSVEPEDRMAEWLEHGGALLLEDGEGGAVAALRWTERGDGWTIDRVATLPEQRNQGYGRWLMTKVEALAIRANVPTLTLLLDDARLLPYYRRMGYREPADGARGALVKRVGGTWQYKGGA